jgi:HEAT repeat protein
VATTGGLGKKRSGGGEGFERWEFWWEQNKEPYLNLKNRLSQTGNVSGSSGFLTGRGKKEEASSSKRPTREIINNEILPSLKKAMQEDHPDILDSAVLALARITRAEDADLVYDDILTLIGSKHQTAQESATLSLGVLGSPKAVPALYELMIDSSEGQRITGKSEVPVLVRAFAALSMGLIGSEDTVDKLFTMIKRAPDKDKDLKACAITALGLMKDSPRKEDIVNYLIKLMADQKMDQVIKATVPTALGKLGDPVALSTVVKAFKKDKQEDLILNSCAIAMGMLGNIEDKEVIDLLKAYINDGKDEQTRHFAFIALGQIGAKDENPEEHQTQHEDLAKFFLKEIVKPAKVTHLPWAGLAGAIHAKEQEQFQPSVIDKVTEAFRKTKNPSHRGAMAICLGLLNAKSQSELLFDELNKSKDKALQGYLCVSLGLMNYKAAAEKVRKIAATEIASFRLRLQAATSLGLMGDTEAVDVLIKALKEGETLSVTSSAAKALGLIGDRSAIEPLRTILDDQGANKLARAFSAVALGIIGEKSDLPWNSVISENYNYRAKVKAISEVLDIL